MKKRKAKKRRTAGTRSRKSEAEKSAQNSRPRKPDRKRLVELGQARAYLMHEMRRPLVTIGLLARSVRARGKLKRKDKATIDAIIQQACAGEELLHDCLRLVQPENGVRKPVSMLSLLWGVRRALLPRAKKARVTIRVGHHKGDEALVFCVQRRMRQALLNVAQNAIEAMAKKGGTVILGLRTRPGSVNVTIEDAGPGMKPDVAEMAFEPFYSTKKGGTGLGLALAEKIIQDHDGRITLKSDSAKGTTVAIRLPKHDGRTRPRKR